MRLGAYRHIMFFHQASEAVWVVLLHGWQIKSIFLSGRELRELAIQHSIEKLFQHPINSWVEPKGYLTFCRILLKRKGDKSVQEYETDAGIQKWTEQRLTKSSAQVSSYVKMYHSTISPSPYQAVISDLQLLLKLLESACMLKELPSHFPYSFPWLFLLFLSCDLSNNY